MNVDDAAALIAPAIVGPGGTWADLGAGGGTFTRALARLLGPAGRVHAVDRDRRAMVSLGGPTIVTHVADFADADAWHALALAPLDGILVANALHYVPHAEQRGVLARLAAALGPGGRLVVVEYEHRAANRWVPHPVDFARLGTIAPAALSTPRRVGTRPSAYGGGMYAAEMAAHTPPVTSAASGASPAGGGA